VFFDNLQLAPEKKFAPRFKLAKKVSVASATFACDATFAMKGNTADKCTPSTKDILKLNCKVGLYKLECSRKLNPVGP
jgi:hypothetical protein